MSTAAELPRGRTFRLRKVLFWGVVLVLSILAGAVGFAYSYVTDSDTLAALIRAEAPRYFPGSSLEVGRVRVRPFVGEVTLSQVRLRQVLGTGTDGAPVFFPTAQVAWVSIRHDLKALAHGEFQPKEIIATQPVLRLRRRPDGDWNLEGLLADPWPAPPLDTMPTVQVLNGTIELHDETGAGPPVMILQGVSLRAEPSREGGPMRIEGEARGGPFDRLQFEGTLDRRTGRLALSRGSMTRLALTESLCRCLPDDADRAAFHQLGLSGGEIDLDLDGLTYDPDGGRAPALRAAGCGCGAAP